jgi:hypothetical protein
VGFVVSLTFHQRTDIYEEGEIENRHLVKALLFNSIPTVEELPSAPFS